MAHKLLAIELVEKIVKCIGSGLCKLYLNYSKQKLLSKMFVLFLQEIDYTGNYYYYYYYLDWTQIRR